MADIENERDSQMKNDQLTGDEIESAATAGADVLSESQKKVQARAAEAADMASKLGDLIGSADIEWQMAGVDFEAAEDLLAGDSAEAVEAEVAHENAHAVEAANSADSAAMIADELSADDGLETVSESFEEEAPIVDLATEVAVLDEDDNLNSEPTEFIEADHAISIIESLLFSTDKPISMATIKQVFKGSNIRTKDISRGLDILASDYANSQRGVCLEEIHGGYQLRTKVDNADYLRRLAKTRPFKLSGPALEVLSIIAYKQPLVKSEVDEIRGVESGHLLRALMDRSLVAFAGKSELPGKPMQYATTRKFLEIFGLRNLKELPTLSEIEELIPEGIGGEEDEKKETLSDLTGQLSTTVGSTYSEGEDELGKITDQLQGINVSSEFFEQEKIRQRDKRDSDRAQNIREALTVGEAVESRDQKWLERYEAKLQAAADLAAGIGVAAHESTDVGAEFEAAGGVEGEIEAEVAADAGAAGAELARGDFEDDEAGQAADADDAFLAALESEAALDDLEANSDYDDEADV